MMHRIVDSWPVGWLPIEIGRSIGGSVGTEGKRATNYYYYCRR